MTKEQFEIDPDTIRSKEQYEQTKKAAGAGCAWCLPDEEQKSPRIHESDLVVVRYNVYEKPNRKMYIVHTKRCASIEDLTPDECYQLFQACHWVHQQDGNLGGGDIHRWGIKERCASSIPDKHFFFSIVAPDGTGPVAETLCKDKSPEKVAERKERSKTFF